MIALVDSNWNHWDVVGVKIVTNYTQSPVRLFDVEVLESVFSHVQAQVHFASLAENAGVRHNAELAPLFFVRVNRPMTHHVKRTSWTGRGWSGALLGGGVGRELGLPRFLTSVVPALSRAWAVAMRKSSSG